MSYEYITDYNAASYTPGRQGCEIDKIILHHWGTDGQTFEGVISWFQSPSSPTSAHEVIEAGRVACIVNHYDTAYHAGNWNANLTSIGLECRPEMSAADLETVCERIADLYSIYGVLPLYGHKDFSSTACPGRYYSKLGYIKQRAIEIMNATEEPETEPEGEEEEMPQFSNEEAAWLKSLYAKSKADKPSDWAADDLATAVDAGITTGERPQDGCSREEAAIMILRAVEKEEKAE